MVITKLRIPIAVAAGVVVIGVGVAVGAGTLSSPRVGAVRAHATAAPVDLGASFAALRRGRTPGDDLPADGLAAIADAQQRFGADPSQSRRALASTNDTLWLVPGNQTLCEVIKPSTGAVSVACTPASAAVAHGMVGSEGNMLMGVLPDGERLPSHDKTGAQGPLRPIVMAVSRLQAPER